MSNTIKNWESYKGRTFNIQKRVEVYYNLHKHCFSVKQHGKVIGHCSEIHLRSAKFKVSASGRARVIKEQKKNVHATVSGYIRAVDQTSNTEMVSATYNPYKFQQFVYGVDDTPLNWCTYAALKDRKITVSLLGTY